MIKKLLLIILIIIYFDINSKVSAQKISTSIIAKVGKEIITSYDLEDEIKFIPQLFYKTFALPFGIQTFQIHLNYFKPEDYNNFEKFIKTNSKKIITYEQALGKVNNNLSHKAIRIIVKKILQVKRFF